MQGIEIKGFGSYVPKHVVTNDDLSKIVDTNDEWISTRTGIKERRISQGEDTSVLATSAAENAMKKANISAEDIDLIIVATVSPDCFCPSVSCIVQKNIGAKNAMAFDINAACSGFIFAFQTASSLLKCNDNFNNALIIGAEVLSKITNWEDRSTCVLFGDGAGAAIISKTDSKKVLRFFSKSEGEKGEALEIGARNVQNPFIREYLEKYPYIKMDGGAIFRFASLVIVKAVKKLLDEENLSLDDIDYIIPHQANARIIAYAAKKMHVGIDKFYLNLDKFANTSSATIPIALSEMQDKNILKEGMKIIMVGFGGGLTYGSALVEL